MRGISLSYTTAPMQLSEQPGIGVELNDEVAKSLLWRGDRYFD